MSLRRSYNLLAPLYDPLIAAATHHARIDSIRRLGDVKGQWILIPGIGTGLDIPHLPRGAHYVGLELTPAMLDRARHRAAQTVVTIDLLEGDAMALPFADDFFDVVLMHLILAVVPQPELALAEAARVLKPGASIQIFDKFLKPREPARVRRLLNPVLRRIATRTDVVLESLLKKTPELDITQNWGVMAGGWFRQIRLKKRESRQQTTRNKIASGGSPGGRIDVS